MDIPGLSISLMFSVGACVGGAWWCLQRLSQLRHLLDTPTSKIRSAAQGYTELYGVLQALPDAAISGPLTGKPCLWWRYKIEEYQQSDKRSTWRSLESGVSEAWLCLQDATGQCLINPRGAEVRPLRREVWQGNQRHPRRMLQQGMLSGMLGMGRRYRYTEERLHEGEGLYAIGDFRTLGGGGQGLDLNAVRGEVIREWKADFAGLLQRFDADASGQLETTEWQRVQQAAEEEAERRHRQASQAPVQHQLVKPQESMPFILSSHGEDELVRKFRWQAAGAALLCLAGALASTWLLNNQL